METIHNADTSTEQIWPDVVFLVFLLSMVSSTQSARVCVVFVQNMYNAPSVCVVMKIGRCFLEETLPYVAGCTRESNEMQT